MVTKISNTINFMLKNNETTFLEDECEISWKFRHKNCREKHKDLLKREYMNTTDH